MIVLCILVALLTMASPSLSATPQRLWIASNTNGQSLDVDASTPLRVLDHFPEALILDDSESAALLKAQGLHVEGPFLPRPGSQVTLLRQVLDGAPAPDKADWSSLNVRVLWQRGNDILVDSMGITAFSALGTFQVQALREHPLNNPRLASPMLQMAPGNTPPGTQATEFEPVIQVMVDQLDPQAYMNWIENLAGGEPVRIGAAPVSLDTRFTATLLCDLSEQYVYEQFVAMGFTDVQYDPFYFSGVDARNVVATLPGSTTPERIFILGAHLDSTSPQPTSSAPGANDNASGVAALLEIARILQGYQFHSTIKFIAFTGEEQGLYGSAHYASEAAANGDQIEGVVICDMIAWYNSQYQIDIEGRNGYLPLMQVMEDACGTYTNLNTSMKFFSFGSDHVPFQNEGFPAFLAIESEYWDYPCYHQTCDVAVNNDADMGADVSRACLATIAHLASPTETTVSTVLPDEAPITRLVLHRNEPNPFNPTTRFRFDLPERAVVQLAIFDVRGRLVRSLLHQELGSGRHSCVWDGKGDAGRSVTSGTYFYRISTPREEVVGKLSLVR